MREFGEMCADKNYRIFTRVITDSGNNQAKNHLHLYIEKIPQGSKIAYNNELVISRGKYG